MIATLRRSLVLPFLWATVSLAVAGLPASAASRSLAAPKAAAGRVIVLGFDGADARTALELMDKGQLPNLAALRDKGSFAPLETTNPAESPVSWAALNCGQNPAKTGVPGFIRRQFTRSKERSGDHMPTPEFGHLAGPEDTLVESFEHTPVPAWSRNVLGGALGLGTLVLFLGVFLLLRMRPALAIALALIMGAGSFIGGRALREYLPSRIPVWKNPMQTVPFWETAGAAGVRSVVLDAAQSFDRKGVAGASVLAGLGVPDARGMVNSFFMYTTNEDRLRRAPEGQDTDSGGVVFRIDERAGVSDSLLPGPVNFWNVDRLNAELREVDLKLDDTNLRYQASMALNARRTELEEQLDSESKKRVTVPVKIVRKAGVALVTLGTESQELSAGAWSEWYHLSFELNPLLKVKAIVRAKLLKLAESELELYVDALQYDPAKPPFWQPISQPPEFAAELAHACGPYETVGWACMNLPLKDNVIDSVSFMQDIEFTLGWREKMTFDSLAKDNWRVLMSCESTPDRVQHMMYRYYDPLHPMYSAEKAAEKMTFCGEEIALSDAIPASYRRMDKFVGEVMKNYLRPEDTLIICSDHGFQSFRHQVHVNNWLIEHGYLVMKTANPDSNMDPSMLGGYVDWSKTKAYALGLGMVYVNQKGREGQGIVPPEEARAVLDSIAKDFLGSVDSQTGQKIGRGAYVMADIHSGPNLDREADMLLCFSEGYRVSWLTTLGGMSGELDGSDQLSALPTIVANNKNWSGDHVTVDPTLVRGVFFSNRKLAAPPEHISLLHIAPTVLKLLGVAIPKEYDEPALEFSAR